MTRTLDFLYAVGNIARCVSKILLRAMTTAKTYSTSRTATVRTTNVVASDQARWRADYRYFMNSHRL
jgi:hypothetical protein